jgi:fused signal recognition particle receptor
LRDSLSKSRRALTGELAAAASFDQGDDSDWERLEEALIAGDVGVRATAELVRRLEARGELADLNAALAEEVTELFGEAPVLDVAHEPAVILVVGVNGTGKTTTIGKLSAKFSAEGRKVMLAAGDTFRAAAIEQLKVWGERTKSPVISGAQGSDSAGLAFNALTAAKEQKGDVLLIDTAGRLQNKAELMNELEKVVRVVRKVDASAPHAVLLVLDATVGQNALSQVEAFHRTAGVTGLVMTKLDGTARGGILVALAEKHRLPVHFIGVGEGVEDLAPFTARDFANAVAGIET